jgi:hypothetical protein
MAMHANTNSRHSLVHSFVCTDPQFSPLAHCRPHAKTRQLQEKSYYFRAPIESSAWIGRPPQAIGPVGRGYTAILRAHPTPGLQRRYRPKPPRRPDLADHHNAKILLESMTESFCHTLQPPAPLATKACPNPIPILSRDRVTSQSYGSAVISQHDPALFLRHHDRSWKNNLCR